MSFNIERHSEDSMADSSFSSSFSSFSAAKQVKKNTALVAAFVNESKNQVIIAFRGTSLTFLDDLKQDFNIFKGNIPEDRILRAIAFVKPYKKSKCCFSFYQRPPKKILLTGHSLGGAIAEYVSLALGIPCVSFESPGVAESSLVMSLAERQQLMTGYVSEPNLVNCAQVHPGRLFYIPFTEPAQAPKEVYCNESFARLSNNNFLNNAMSSIPGAPIVLCTAKFIGQSELMAQAKHTAKTHKMKVLHHAFANGHESTFIEVTRRWPNYMEFTRDLWKSGKTLAEWLQSRQQDQAVVTAAKKAM